MDGPAIQWRDDRVQTPPTIARDRKVIGPWTIHRNRRGWPTWWQRWLEAWWIVTGEWSLHRAWQCGLDHGTKMEYQRTVVMGGR